MPAFRIAAAGGKLPEPKRARKNVRSQETTTPDIAADSKLPLKALRAFDAAARYLSFTKAAEELHVTTGAVSHQIKMLEDALGIKLFHRRNNSLTLTAAGADFLPDIRESFRLLNRATERVAARADVARLIIAVPPTLGSRWLAPRVSRFVQQHDFVVDVVAANALEDIGHTGFDIAIRYGPVPQVGYESELVAVDEVFPVCSPKLCKGRHPLKKLADLRHFTLLHYPCMLKNHVFADWATWLSLAGMEGLDSTRTLTFYPGTMAIDAAVAGTGIALGKAIVVADDLLSGRLVRPFDIDVGLRSEHHIVFPKATRDHPSHVAVREWLKAELLVSSKALKAAF
jgi:LysR family glycine cleavage system transcriptional activator